MALAAAYKFNLFLEFYFHFIFSCGPTSLPGNSISTLFFSCGPTSLPGCSSTVQWSSFDFLESSSSLRKVVQEGIPPAATKTSTLSDVNEELGRKGYIERNLT
jgi:hypothetical protein